MKKPKNTTPRLSEAETKRNIEETKDFIALRHHQNSMKVLSKRYPDEVPNHVIARALGMTERQVQSMFRRVVLKLRKAMGVKVD